MKLKTIKKRIVIYLVNHTLAGTRFFSEKRNLLRSIGYEIGENTKIVGPIYNTGTLRIGANCWIGCNLTVHGNGIWTLCVTGWKICWLAPPSASTNNMIVTKSPGNRVIPGDCNY